MLGGNTTRLAPSPTGLLHLGNARTFVINWALARQRGWRVVLRMEDLDGPRIKPGAAEAVVDTLRWLGLDWDEGPTYQSHDLSPYESALVELAAAGQAYPCRCTRTQIAAAALSAPHAADHELLYPGTCRPALVMPIDYQATRGEGEAWRLRAPDELMAFDDAFAGKVAHNLQQSVGDFVVATKAGLPSYQLAVVVDDARQRVTHVVRGDDLLLSTPRQLLLFDRLKLGAPPVYFHVPLVIGEDGRRLAKRHGDSRIDRYRQADVSAERILGLIAEWCGMGARREISRDGFLKQFQIDAVPTSAIIFNQDDDNWLMQKTS